MKTAYVILGMHRSGTSSVAGSLVLLGGHPPATLMEPKDENPKGFWESEKIMVLNDQIFQSVGSSWQDWGPIDPGAFSGQQGQEFLSAARGLIESEFGGADAIVLKDPRICRLYRFWRAALVDTGYAPIVVLPVRAPAEVVASLVARNAMPPTLAMRLWLSHVLEAEEASRGDPRHIMLWPEFISCWRDHIVRIAALGGPELLAEGVDARVDEFLNTDLHRQRAPMFDPARPDLVLRTMDAMERLARNEDVPSAMESLDRVRGNLAVARQLFYDGPY